MPVPFSRCSKSNDEIVVFDWMVPANSTPFGTMEPQIPKAFLNRHLNDAVHVISAHGFSIVLSVEDVWDQSGAKRDGYVSTGETAWQMFEAAMEPFREDILKYQQLSMSAQAEAIYLGILKGVYDFEWCSTTEFKDWAVDVPAEFFSSRLGEWEEHFPKRSSLAKLKQFLTAHCPRWAEQAI